MTISRIASIGLILLYLSACTTVRAPVSSRTAESEPEPTISSPRSAARSGGVVTRPARPVGRPVGQNTAPKPVRKAELYTVRPGDTLYSIAWQHGLTVNELAHLNSLESPWTIYPGQALRIQGRPGAVAPAREYPVPQPGARVAKAPVKKPPPRVTRPVPRASPGPASAAKKPAGKAVAFDGKWAWPTRGRVVRGFRANATGKKGIDISGHFSQPVKAAAGGRVVYSGSGLVGYGRLIIIKHNENLLSAYGHNSKLLVEEGDHVQRGEQIAKMGNSGTDRAELYFEIRKNGKPVNPMQYLPRN